MRGAADDDNRRPALLPARRHAHFRKIVLKKLAQPFEPIGDDPRAFFQARGSRR